MHSVALYFLRGASTLQVIGRNYARRGGSGSICAVGAPFERVCSSPNCRRNRRVLSLRVGSAARASCRVARRLGAGTLEAASRLRRLLRLPAALRRFPGHQPARRHVADRAVLVKIFAGFVRRQGVQHAGPDPLLRPAVEADVVRVPLPKCGGRLRQGEPVRTIQNTASMKRRLSRPWRPGSLSLPGRREAISAQRSSVR